MRARNLCLAAAGLLMLASGAEAAGPSGAPAGSTPDRILALKRALWGEWLDDRPGVALRYLAARSARAFRLDRGPAATGADVPREAVQGAAATPVPPNLRCNDPRGDDPAATQSEPTVAIVGRNVLVAWNDGQGFVTGGDTQGWSYSTNGGLSFVKGGPIPKPAGWPQWSWYSDPVVCANPRTGDFYYCAMALRDPYAIAIGVAHGRFTNGAFAFDSTFVVGSEDLFEGFVDKPWITADSLTGNVYVCYTDRLVGSVDIVFFRSRDSGRTWEGDIGLSSAQDNGYVEGARVAVGPDGTVHAIWAAMDPSGPGDHVRYRASNNDGASFGDEQTVVTYTANFGSGAPGYNRPFAFSFPSLAVDPRGVPFVTWSEGLDVTAAQFPSPDTARSVVEVEPNDTRLQAMFFTVGNVLRGTLATRNDSTDTDTWAMILSAGQSVVVWCDSITPVSAWTLRLIEPGGEHSLCYGGVLDSTSSAALGGTGQAMWQYTAPRAGVYQVRIAGISRLPAGYRIRTAYLPVGASRARDQRDVFISHPLGNGSWSTPIRLNDDPSGFDNFLPEVGVDAWGNVYAAWYDYRDDPFGAVANVYMARNGDIYVPWEANRRLTTAPSDFSTCQANIVPNMGDYFQMASDSTRLAVAWSDARGSSVDCYCAVLNTGLELTHPPLDAYATPGEQLSLPFSFAAGNGLFPARATLFWYDDRGWYSFPFTSFDGVVVQPGGNATFSVNAFPVPDTASPAGNTLHFLVAEKLGTVARDFSARVIILPAPLSATGAPARLQLDQPSPNPGRGSALVTWSLPAAGAARVRIFDAAGREIRTLASGQLPVGSGRMEWDGRNARGEPAPSGVYFVRLEYAGRRLEQRLVLLR